MLKLLTAACPNCTGKECKELKRWTPVGSCLSNLSQALKWQTCSHDPNKPLVCCCLRTNKQNANYRWQSMKGWQRSYRLEAAEIREDIEPPRSGSRPSKRKRSLTGKKRSETELFRLMQFIWFSKEFFSAVCSAWLNRGSEFLHNLFYPTLGDNQWINQCN